MALFNQNLSTTNPLYRRPIVSELTGKSRSTLYRDIQKGLFTPAVSIGGDRVAWPANDIQVINSARIAGKSEEEIKQLVSELVKSRGGK